MSEPTIKQIIFTADGLTRGPMPTEIDKEMMSQHIDSLRAENAALKAIVDGVANSFDRWTRGLQGRDPVRHKEDLPVLTDRICKGDSQKVQDIQRLERENAALLKRLREAEAACAEMRRDYEEYAYDYHDSRRLNGDIAHTGMFCDCADPTCKQARTWLENNPGQRILALLDKMESALLSIRDNGLDARQCQLAAKNALDK